MSNEILLYVFLFLGLAILLKFLKPKIKGFLGELLIRFVLLFLNKKEYKIIHDVKVFYNGLMSQIDHVVVSKYGIFVIETKNYKGWIFGSENAYEWTQVIFNNKYKLYNPVKQNLGHVRALQANLADYPNLDYFPIVVFTGSARLKVNCSYPVIIFYRLLKTIKSSKEINISEFTRDEIYNLLLKINGNIPNIEAKKFGNTTIKQKNNLCPDCNSPLIPKQGKFGRFMGCTNFPRCRYTKRLS
ncbi:NERD domain-containing protein [Sphingobacterium hungaricum]|uniref:NERD nuclease n=1 Tax=Sphingobacterium hungaricum TaxID=2082723 RepID=A0A928UX83_9SPHI|nr:NERD domain-containing protein [Sphingobacterium hungaricum]MBE8714367.1 NERD nuclease [Sphingobacterium hungaricum]